MENKGGFIARVLINSVAIYITALFVKGIDIRSFGAAIGAAIIMGIVNALIRPVLIILSLPINIMTLGLFTFIINGISLLIVSGITSGFYVAGLGAAAFGSIIISIVSSIISFIVL